MSTDYKDVDDFMFAGGVASAFRKDSPIGTTVTGIINEAPKKTPQTDLVDGTPLTWPSGDIKMQIILTISTDLREHDEDDGARRLYLKGSTKAGSQSLLDAVTSAVRAAGAPGLRVGGRISVTYIGNEPSSTRGFSDRKLYSATYMAPDGSDTDALLTLSTPQPVAPLALAVAAPAPAVVAPSPAVVAPAPAHVPNPTDISGQVKTLHSQGLNVTQIATALNQPENVVAALIAM